MAVQQQQFHLRRFGFGTIGSGGPFSGELDFTNFDDVLLNGSLQSPLGSFQNAAGYFSGPATGNSGGNPISATIYAILSANGQMVFAVFSQGAVNDGGKGRMGGNNQFTSTSVNGTTVSGTLTNATLKIGGTFSSSGTSGHLR